MRRRTECSGGVDSCAGEDGGIEEEQGRQSDSLQR